MTQHRSDGRRERAAFHALGALDGEERTAFERLLEDKGASAQAARADVASFQRTAAQLASAIRPVVPPPGLKAQLPARIQVSQPQAPLAAHPGFTFIRSTEGTWVEPLPGMKLKVLHVDPLTQRTTAIVKFASGYRHAPHRHAETEELFVLEGGRMCQGEALLPGDHHRSDAHSVHGETSTEDGCTLLMIFSPRNAPIGSFSARLSSATVTSLFRFSALLTRLVGRFSRPT